MSDTDDRATLSQRLQDAAREIEHLRTTIASMGDAVIATDAEGRIVTLNVVAETLTGWTTREAVGQPLEKIFRIVNENTREPVESPVTRALREGKIVGLANHTLLIARDGVERPIDDSAAPINDRDGRALGCVLVFRDVAERRRLERESAQRLAASRLLASIVESSNDAIVSKSLDGIIRSWNATAELLFGYSADEAIGQHISLIIPEDRASEEDLIVGRIRAGERVDHFETVRKRKDGSMVHVSLTISPITDEMGRIVGASKIARDVTDRKQAEERIYALVAELKEADRLKDEFLAMLGHELRNPIAPLSNMLEIMKRASGNDALIHEARATMERQLAHLVRLVDDLVDVSRITRGKLELRKERVELEPILRQSVEACRPLAEKTEIGIDVTVPTEPIFLEGDTVRLVQVFGNILANACKFSDPGGRVLLDARREGSDVVVRVKDAGIGISPDKLESVFDMFTQIDRGLERTQSGLGIGLTLVRRIVRMLGGSVTAASEGLGRGAEFTVRLPLLVEGRVERRHVPTPDPVVVPRSILVVDDNVDAAGSLAMLLRLSGHRTHLAHDGLEAIAWAEAHHPDVILLDIGLPRLNGYDTCRRIRASAWGKEPLIVAMTGWGQEGDRQRSRDAGFDEHMVKPVDYEALMRILARRSSVR